MSEFARIRAQLAVLIFAVSLAHASICSLICGSSVCPLQAQDAEHQGCNHSGAGQTGDSHHQGRNQPSCANQLHRSALFIKKDLRLASHELRTVGYTGGHDSDTGFSVVPISQTSGVWRAGSAPPIFFTNPHLQPSVLRI
jgi:hypothetical protein